MAITIGTQTNIDKSNLAAYPNGQIKDDTGIGDGTPINRDTSSDIWEVFDKLMRLAGISFNNIFDNEINGYQYVDALIALAAKSDYVRALTTSAGVLNLDTKLGILQNNEKLLALAASDFAGETNITGTDSPLVTKAIIITKQWKAGDYLLLVNTVAGIKIIQTVTGDNISNVALDNNFLKAANNAVTLAGISTAAAVTPASLLYAFQERISDPTEVESAPFEASASQPGIMSIALFNKLNGLINPIKNSGWITGVNPGNGTVGSTYTKSGNITSATIQAVYSAGIYAVGGVLVGNGTNIRVVLQNAMADTNYKIRFEIEGIGSIDSDSLAWQPIFQIVNTTTFDMVIREAANQTEALKIHIEAIQLT